MARYKTLIPSGIRTPLPFWRFATDILPLNNHLFHQFLSINEGIDSLWVSLQTYPQRSWLPLYPLQQQSMGTVPLVQVKNHPLWTQTSHHRLQLRCSWSKNLLPLYPSADQRQIIQIIPHDHRINKIPLPLNIPSGPPLTRRIQNLSAIQNPRKHRKHRHPTKWLQKRHLHHNILKKNDNLSKNMKQ